MDVVISEAVFEEREPAEFVLENSSRRAQYRRFEGCGGGRGINAGVKVCIELTRALAAAIPCIKRRLLGARWLLWPFAHVRHEFQERVACLSQLCG